MEVIKLILYSSWTPLEQDTIQSRHLLHQEKNGMFCYNRENITGEGYHTFARLNFEEVLEYFMKQVKADKKQYKPYPIQIFIP